MSARIEPAVINNATRGQLMDVIESVQQVLDQWSAEAAHHRAEAKELRMAPRTAPNRREIERSEHAAVMSHNHAVRIRNAMTEALRGDVS